jgi:hypothetical protein
MCSYSVAKGTKLGPIDRDKRSRPVVTLCAFSTERARRTNKPGTTWTRGSES